MFASYRRLFPGAAVSAYALYGYEAMEDVLRSIKLAGRYGARRPNVVGVFFKRLGSRDGVLGRYTIDANGDTSLRRFDGYRAGPGGTLVLVRPIS